MRCTDVARTYGRGLGSVVAVHGATCTIGSDDRIAVIGPSGSGKSTLLHLFAGLDEVTKGTITWPTMNDEPRRPGRIGLVFQGPSLLSGLDAVDNVAFPLVLAGAQLDRARAQAVQVLERLGMAQLAHRLPEELSGGQAQRVAIARVLASEPDLILADEPTGQLDHDTARQVMQVVIDAADRTNAALVVNTHDRDIAALLATTWHMVDGRLLTQRHADLSGGSR